jgi:hypothetical protein
MKVRRGFVSNSSSSSFVVVGVEFNDQMEKRIKNKLGVKDDDSLWNVLEDKGYLLIYDEDNPNILGIELTDASDYQLDYAEYNFEQLIKKMKEVSDFTGCEDVRLYMGTREC